MSESAAIQGVLTQPARDPSASLRAGRDIAALRDGSGFASFLKRSTGAATDPIKSRDEMLQEAAGHLVADAFILPLLETMHDSPLRPQSGPFAAGTAEKRFMPLLDQQFADRITQSNHFPLVDSVVKHLSKVSRPKSGGDHAAA